MPNRILNLILISLIILSGCASASSNSDNVTNNTTNLNNSSNNSFNNTTNTTNNTNLLNFNTMGLNSAIYISPSGDDNNSGLNPSSPKKTLKNALSAVTDGGTIYLAAGVYSGLNNTNLTLNKSVTLIGDSSDSTTITGSNSDRILYVSTGVVSIRNLKFTDGKSDMGSAIYNQGIIVIENCVFSNNGHGNSTSSNGGAIYNDGTCTLNSCVFSSNRAAVGGGIYQKGTGSSKLTINNCEFNGNNAHNGGALTIQANGDPNASKCTITNTKFIGNDAEYDGGAIASWGYLKLSDSDFESNLANRGGSIYLSGSSITSANSSNFRTSQSNLGGVFFVNTGTFNAVENNILNNQANVGTVLYNSGATVSLNFNRIVNNSETENYVLYGRSTTNAKFNWWGSNSPDFESSIMTRNTNTAPWLVLSLNATPSVICYRNSSSVNTNLLYDSNGTRHDPSEGHVPDGIPVESNCDELGTLTPLNTAMTQGSAFSTFQGLALGVSNVSSIVDGQLASTNITLEKVSTDLTLDSKNGYKGDEINLTAKLMDISANVPLKGKTVSFSVDGVLIGNVTTDDNGTATLNYRIAPDSGDYNITAEFLEESEYKACNNSSILTVNKIPTSLQFTNASILNGQPSVLKMYLLDVYGRPVGGQNVTLCIDDLNISSTTDDAGLASFNFTPEAQGCYNITGIYDGAVNYIDSNTTGQVIVKPASYIDLTMISNGDPIENEKFTLKYKLENKGPNNATNVSVTINLPAQFDLIDIKGDSKWNCNSSKKTVNWTFDDLNMGAHYLYLTGKISKRGEYSFISKIESETYNTNTEKLNCFSIEILEKKDPNHGSWNGKLVEDDHSLGSKIEILKNKNYLNSNNNSNSSNTDDSLYNIFLEFASNWVLLTILLAIIILSGIVWKIFIK